MDDGSDVAVAPNINVVNLIFEGRKEVMEIVNTGGSLVGLLAGESLLCPLIGSDITLIKEVGRGKFGTVFSINFGGMGVKKYVVKKMKAVSVKYKGDEDITLGELAEKRERKKDISGNILIAINGGDPNVKIKDLPEPIWIPKYAEICQTKEIEVIKKHGRRGNTIIPKGSYVCEQEIYSEYFIGLLLARFYQTGKSINFVDTFAFATCAQEKSQYIFMEMINCELHEILDKIDSKTASSIFIQILHSIAMYQHRYNIGHNDLHSGNIFIEKVTEETQFNGELLRNADYHHYKVFETDLYVPAVPYIVKIGDFGLSVKWSEPIVGDKASIDKRRKSVPNWYSVSYDIVFIANIFNEFFPHNRLIRNVFSYVSNYTFPESAEMMEEIREDLIKKKSSRPVVSLLVDRSAIDVLTDKELMKRFLKPNEGKTVTLGVLD
uniref:non-specific serine/threonine protein kinase n=1 Tax=Marseillevirus LCMAC101 TaxID=2506602 RepID=A0A481YSI6_9VIRU|nr:MAG: protein kinase [Marseillevirus LCMAC101]